MRTQVVIPFYKEQEQLDRCIKHLEASSFKNFSLFVRDNSIDNIHFTAAVNEGILNGMRMPETEYFLILNQDCYLEHDALAQLVNTMKLNEDCGIASPIQVSESGDITWAGSLDAFPFGVHNTRITEDEKSSTHETFWANGACMLIRRRLIQEIGIFDPNYKFICSDADFSFTARTRGWKVLLDPRARVEHSLGGSSATADIKLEIIKHLDIMYFYDKWLSGDLFRKLSSEGAQMTPDHAGELRREIEGSLEGLIERVERLESKKPLNFK